MINSNANEVPIAKSKNRNIGLIVFLAIFIILIVIVSIMKVMGLEWGRNIYEVFKEVLELLYFLSGVGLIIGLYIGYKQLEIMNKDIKIRNERAAVDKSLDYLNFFAETLLPKTSQYYKDISKEEPLKFDDWDPKVNDYKFNVFLLEDELQLKTLQGLVARQEKGIQDILNHLEFFSAGILHGLAKEEVVYDPLSGVFCRLIKKEIITLCALRNQGSPYENLLELYVKWSLRKENDAKLLQIKEAEHTIKLAKQQVAADVESTKPQKPIGL